MEEQPHLVGSGLCAGCAIRGEMGFPGLDVIFGLSTPTVDPFVEPAGRALFEIGCDEASVGTLIADFDAGENAFDAAPAFGAVVKCLEAAHLAFAGRGLEARFRAGLEISDMAAQCRGRRYAQDEVVPFRPAPVDDLGTAIVTIAAQQDLRPWPVGADRTQQAAQESPDFLAAGPFGRAQHGGDEATFAIEHDDGLEPIFVMLGH